MIDRSQVAYGWDQVISVAKHEPTVNRMGDLETATGRKLISMLRQNSIAMIVLLYTMIN